MFRIAIFTLLTLAVAVLAAVESGESEAASSVPEHLQNWPGLYVREGDRIVDAPPTCAMVAMSYPFWEDKGEIVDGRRITILTSSTTFSVGEDIPVIHIMEAPAAGYDVYIMGPKEVYGEYIDGVEMTKTCPGGTDPFVPDIYNGAVLSSPAVDYNYDITTYTFDEPGIHQIQWILGRWHSNILSIKIIPN